MSGALLAGRKLVSVLKLTKCIYTIYSSAARPSPVLLGTKNEYLMQTFTSVAAQQQLCC